MLGRSSCLFVGLFLVACGGAAFDGQVYRDGDLAFRVGPRPANWRALQAENTLMAFRDDRDGATVAVNGRCGKDGDDVPLEALTHHLFLHFTERKVESQERLSLDGRDALRTVLSAKLDGVSKHFVVIVLKKDGCVYDFLHISGGEQAASDEFEGFVRGFATLSRVEE
ncbi:MAG: hypothetical protein IPI67_00645 [Myxococcales bacterium]|nr:hypothetical protein [Myxococcales bacterium]